MSNMEIKQLRCFVAAAQTGNFTRASEQLNLAQSALSRHIANLETNLGVELFCRKGRGVALSPAGVRAYDRARQVLDDIKELRRDLSQWEGSVAKRKIVLSAHGGMGPAFLPRVVRRIPQDHGAEPLQFTVREALSEQIEQEVASGDCDVGIVIRRRGFKIDRVELEAVKLIDDRMYAVGVAEHGMPHHASWPAVTVLRRPLVLAPVGSLERASFESWARKSGVVSLDVVGEAAQVQTRLEMARQFKAISVVPGIALGDLLHFGNWQVHPIDDDNYLNGIEWFATYRRADGDRLTLDIVDTMQRQALELNTRSRAAFSQPSG